MARSFEAQPSPSASGEAAPQAIFFWVALRYRYRRDLHTHKSGEQVKLYQLPLRAFCVKYISHKPKFHKIVYVRATLSTPASMQ